MGLLTNTCAHKVPLVKPGKVLIANFRFLLEAVLRYVCLYNYMHNTSRNASIVGQALVLCTTL